VAHDLGNYLQVIASAVRIMERSLDREACAALEPVVRGAHASLDRAYCLSRQVAADASRLPANPSRVSIADRIAALEAIMLLAVGPAVSIDFLLGDAPQVLCDGEALDDAVMNLVVNAGRAMPNGGKLSIGVSRDLTHDGLPEAVLRVADTGCGMDPEIAARAFASGTTTKSGSGCGIGLATVDAFARSAGGSASLESWIGAGTIVTVRLPGQLKMVRGCRNS
jgi:signal transduction histidine kinase